MSIQKIGLIVGKFYPLHQGHINMILAAKLAVDELYVFVCSETDRDWELFLESEFTKAPSSEDRVNWAKEMLSGISGITVHGFNEDGIPAYPNGWQAWSDRLKTTLHALNIQPTVIFSSELQDKDFYESYFHTEVTLVDPPRDKFPVSATKIRTRPFQYWTYIPTMIRPFFTRTIVIDADIFRNPTLLPAILKLFNTVEVPGFEKIQFEIIQTSQIAKLIEHAKEDSRMISALIGDDSFIAKFKMQTQHSQLLKKCEVLQLSHNTHDAKDHHTEQDRLIFNEVSSFINRLMLRETLPQEIF